MSWRKPFLGTLPVFGLLAAQVALSLPANAAPGDLDPTFGIGGKVTTDFAVNGFSDDAGYAVALEPDGKIVVAGTSYLDSSSSGADFALARYNPDGTLDGTFGAGGRVSTVFGGNPSFGEDMVLQPDGKIVVAGFTFTSPEPDFNADFALARYNPDGTLDATFGTGGKVVTDLSLEDDAEAVALLPDGKIIVGGRSFVSGVGGVWTLVRYNQDGSLDSSFGTSGKVTTNINNIIIDIAIQPDGKIVAGGESLDDFALARFNPDGSLDSSFGTGGKVLTRTTGEGGIHALALQPDGKIVVAGGSFLIPLSETVFELVRYNPDGTLDGSFGAGGKITTSFGGTNEYALDVVLQSDGKIVAPGFTATTGSSGFALARYNPDGSLDGSFGAGGKVTTAFASGDAAAFTLALQSDGKIVAAGQAAVGSTEGYDFAVARYQGLSALTVPIDIKPGSTTNPIKLSSTGRIPVAILSISSFDATTVDRTSVCFGDAEAPAQRDCTAAHSSVEDVNADGRLDLLLSFETRQTGIDPGDTKACLTGRTFAGLDVEGCDSVKTL